MGGVGHEPPLGGHQLLESGCHAIELAAEGSDLGRPRVRRGAGGEVTAAKTASGAFQVRQRPGDRAGHHQAERRHDGQHPAGEGEEGEPRRVHSLVDAPVAHRDGHRPRGRVDRSDGL